MTREIGYLEAQIIIAKEEQRQEHERRLREQQKVIDRARRILQSRPMEEEK